jgi:hypothetical protein
MKLDALDVRIVPVSYTHNGSILNPGCNLQLLRASLPVNY